MHGRQVRTHGIVRRGRDFRRLHIVRGKSSMDDLDDIGFPVETAKRKIFHVRVSRTAPALRSPTAARSRAVP